MKSLQITTKGSVFEAENKTNKIFIKKLFSFFQATFLAEFIFEVTHLCVSFTTLGLYCKHPAILIMTSELAA